MSRIQFMAAVIVIAAVSEGAFLFTAWMDKKKGRRVIASDYTLLGTVKLMVLERMEMRKARKRQKEAGRKKN